MNLLSLLPKLLVSELELLLELLLVLLLVLPLFHMLERRDMKRWSRTRLLKAPSMIILFMKRETLPLKTQCLKTTTKQL